MTGNLISKRGCSDVPHDAHALMAHQQAVLMTPKAIQKQVYAHCRHCKYTCAGTTRTKGFTAGSACDYIGITGHSRPVPFLDCKGYGTRKRRTQKQITIIGKTVREGKK